MPGPMRKSPPAWPTTNSASPAQDVPALYAHAAALPGIQPVGIALHIGSQILSPAPYAAAYAQGGGDGAGICGAAGQTCRVLDLGGGLGIGYGDEPGMSLAAFADVVKREVGGLGCRADAGAGRYLVGPAGLLLASVILEKHSGEKRFVVLDAAMNDLMRPAMYDAWHGILPVERAAIFRRRRSPADVVGPVCETADSFAAGRTAAGAGAGRARGDPGCRRLWRGDEQHL